MFGGPLLLKKYLPKELVTLTSQMSPSLVGVTAYKMGISFMLYRILNGILRCIRAHNRGPLYLSGYKRVRLSLLKKAAFGALNLVGYAMTSKLIF